MLQPMTEVDEIALFAAKYFLRAQKAVSPQDCIRYALANWKRSTAPEEAFMEILEDRFNHYLEELYAQHKKWQWLYPVFSPPGELV